MTPYPAELHERAMDSLTRLLLRAAGNGGDVEQWDSEMEGALRHVVGCQQCLAELDATVRVLSRGIDSIAPSCQDCAPLLSEVASRDEAEAWDRFPLVWLHLQLCEDCRSVVARLRNMIARERAGAYGPVPGAPTFGAIAMAMPVEVWQQVREGVHRLALQLAVVPQEDGVILRPVQDGRAIPVVQLPPGWRLQPVAVPVRRAAAGRGPGKVWSVALPTDGGLEIRLTAYSAGQEYLELEVSVRSEQPLAGARVTLTDEQGLSPWTEETDARGAAFLTDVGPKPYTLEVAHAGSTWLIPIDLSLA